MNYHQVKSKIVKTRIVLLFVLCWFSTNAFSQQFLVIKFKDGHEQSIPLTDIVKIDFRQSGGNETQLISTGSPVGTWRSSGSTWTITETSSGSYFAQENGLGAAKGPCTVTAKGSYLCKCTYNGGSATLDFRISADGQVAQGTWSDPINGTAPISWTRVK